MSRSRQGVTHGGDRFDEVAATAVKGRSYPALLERARSLLALRQYDEAISILRDASSKEPQDAAPSCLISQCHLGMNRPADALRAADDAIALAPENVWAHRLRAQALRALGRHDEARHAADVASNLPPSENLASLTTRLLRARRQRLVRSLPEMEGLIDGSVVQRDRRCGKDGCRCASGEVHGPYTHVVLPPRTGARARTAYVEAASVEAVRRGTAAAACVTDTIAQISAINVELLVRGELD